MHLHNLVDLSAEVVDDIQQTTFCADKNLADLAGLPASGLRIFYELVGTGGIVEYFATGCVVQGYELAGQEVVLDLKEAYVLFTTTNQTCVNDLVELEAHELKIAQLASK